VRIIYIDRGIPYRRWLGAELSSEDTVHGVADEQFLLKAPEAARQADVIVVGPNRSIASVLSLSAELHKVGINTPIVNLMAAPRWTDASGSHPAAKRVDGLHIEAMLSELKQLAVSIAQLEGHDRLVHGKLVLEPGRVARWDDVEVPLTARELDIVRLLVLSLGEFVSYATLHAMGRVSAGAVSLGHQKGRVARFLSSIDKKFYSCDATFSEIQHHPDLGFRWGGRHLAGPGGNIITLPRTKG